jgi:hypothetical protein
MGPFERKSRATPEFLTVTIDRRIEARRPDTGVPSASDDSLNATLVRSLEGWR